MLRPSPEEAAEAHAAPRFGACPVAAARDTAGFVCDERGLRLVKEAND
jgi:hypothetical protein